MNDEFVNDVLRDMLAYLDNGQAEQLRRVLRHNLSGYEIQRRTDSTAEDASTENTRLTDAFLSAKRIEGCSEKSLSYYRKTIETMSEKIGKGITHITTNDLRSYLTDYQAERKSSKVTIDNIRRILSSFFSRKMASPPQKIMETVGISASLQFSLYMQVNTKVV